MKYALDELLDEHEPGAMRPVPLRPVQRPVSSAPHPIRRLEVSEDGAFLFVAREGGGEPLAYSLINLRDGETRWEYRDPCCAGSPPRWSVRLGANGAALLLGFGPDAPAQLLSPSGALSLVEGGDPELRWAPGGRWFGGAGGAWSADGDRLGGPPLPEAELNLVLPGPREGTLRLVADGVLYTWDGQTPPASEGLGPDVNELNQARLTEEGYFPPRPAPDGQHLAAHDRLDPSRVRVLSLDGEEWEEVPAFVRAVAWSSPTALWALVANGEAPGEITRVELQSRDFAGEPATPLPWPQGERASALAAATKPPALYVGTEEGNVYRIDLP